MEAIELIGERLPDVVLIDVHLPSGSGAAVTAAVRNQSTPRCVSSLSSVSDAPEDVIAVHPFQGARLRDEDDRRAPRNSSTPYCAWRAGTPSSLRGWRGSCSTPSPPSPRRSHRVLTPISISFQAARSGEACGSSPAATRTRSARCELTISVKTIESHVSSVLRKVLQLLSRSRALSLGDRAAPRLTGPSGSPSSGTGAALCQPSLGPSERAGRVAHTKRLRMPEPPFCGMTRPLRRPSPAESSKRRAVLAGSLPRTAPRQFAESALNGRPRPPGAGAGGSRRAEIEGGHSSAGPGGTACRRRGGRGASSPGCPR